MRGRSSVVVIGRFERSLRDAAVEGGGAPAGRVLWRGRGVHCGYLDRAVVESLFVCLGGVGKAFTRTPGADAV
jgi:hypothetical protein